MYSLVKIEFQGENSPSLYVKNPVKVHLKISSVIFL